jgi:glycosyltransferase involved in cell wall biosynthesis
MKISLILPTNRSTYSAIARVLELASVSPEKFEVIIRDNSEDARKREFLALVDSSAVRLYSVPNRGPFENFAEAFRLATGEFILFVGDDDWVSTTGLDLLHTRALSAVAETEVAIVTGDYLVESTSHTWIVRYQGLDSASPEARLTGYLTTQAPNLLYYSAIRRALVQRSFAFSESLPYKLSFHDQLVSLFYLIAGRTMSIERVVYFYNLGIWETAEGTLEKDRACYREAGLPIEVDRLHWLICGMEGAFLLKSDLMSQYRYDRVRLLDIWFSMYFSRFKLLGRESGYADTPANVATKRVRDKWLEASEANLSELLLDICDVFELVDKPGAERYFHYWSTL